MVGAIASMSWDDRCWKSEFYVFFFFQKNSRQLRHILREVLQESCMLGS